MPELPEKVDTIPLLRIEVEGKQALIHVSKSRLDRLGDLKEATKAVREAVQASFDKKIKGTEYEGGFADRTVELWSIQQILEKTGGVNYDDYEEWTKLLGLETLEKKDFEKEIRGKSVKKRFNYILRNGMYVGRNVRKRHRRDDKGKAIGGFTPDCGVHFGGTNAEDPMSYVVVI